MVSLGRGGLFREVTAPLGDTEVVSLGKSLHHSGGVASLSVQGTRWFCSLCVCMYV